MSRRAALRSAAAFVFGSFLRRPSCASPDEANPTRTAIAAHASARERIDLDCIRDIRPEEPPASHADTTGKNPSTNAHEFSRIQKNPNSCRFAAIAGFVDL